MFKVEQEFIDNADRNTLKVIDDSGEREYSDHGEPEDNSFYRDYKWIKAELEKAYSQGRKDGAQGITIADAEELVELAQAGLKDEYRRLYYPSSVTVGSDDVQSFQERTADWLK